MATLSDQFEPTLWPLLHLKPLFSYPVGIYSSLERALKNGENKLDILAGKGRDEKFYFDFFKAQNIQIDLKFLKESNSLKKPHDLLTSLAHEINQDIKLLPQADFTSKVNCAFAGSENDIYLHKTAQVSPAAFIDSQDGPVVIDEGASVSPFSWLRGPLYLGKHSSIDKGNIQNCRIGTTCKLGGEVADSIIGDYTNKHHEGFLGHSLVGDWVNLGALTTTSDLKNNYGQISFDFKGILYAAETIKFGSIIGDFCKTAIGTMLNTGTIIDIGCLLFDGFRQRKYIAPFFWGGPGDLYKWPKFEADITRVMARRKQAPTEFQLQQLQVVYSEYLQA